MYENNELPGLFVMTGKSAVSYNEADFDGGGIVVGASSSTPLYEWMSYVRIGGSAWVHHNKAGASGGGGPCR